MEIEHQGGMAIVGRYTYPYEADLARAVLELNEIEAWVLDVHQVQTRWHLSAALGGVKVAVASENAESAIAILAEDRSANLSDIPESQDSPHPDELCPACGGASDSTGPARPRLSLRTLAGAVATWLFGVLLPLRRVSVELRCSRCGETWSRESTR